MYRITWAYVSMYCKTNKTKINFYCKLIYFIMTCFKLFLDHLQMLIGKLRLI